jgi:hypothetical protein
VTPMQASALVLCAAVSILIFLLGLNLGRMEERARYRNCEPHMMTYTIPFKGGIPDDY